MKAISEISTKIVSKSAHGQLPNQTQYARARNIGDAIAATVDEIRLWPHSHSATSIQQRLSLAFNGNGSYLTRDLCEKLLQAASASHRTTCVYTESNPDLARKVSHPLHLQINFWPGDRKNGMTGELQLWFDDGGMIYLSPIFEIINSTVVPDTEL